KLEPGFLEEQKAHKSTGRKQVDEARQALSKNGFVVDCQNGVPCTRTFSWQESYTMQAALANFKSRRAYPRQMSDADENKIIETLIEHYRTDIKADVKKFSVKLTYTAYAYESKASPL